MQSTVRPAEFLKTLGPVLRAGLAGDRKALQAGTSHFLGQNFAKAQDITYLSDEGKLVINAPNCIDCKATDVIGPRWQPREGASGPRYRRM